MKLIILLSIVLLISTSSRKVKTGTSALPTKNLPFSEYSAQLRELYKTAKNDVEAEAVKVNSTPKTLSKAKLKAKELYPTQGEIALSKSLKYLVYSKFTATNDSTANIGALTTKCTATTGDGADINGPLVVAKIKGKDGYAILDGHHRWAQLFLTSPDCVTYCLLAEGEFDTVDDALKSGLYLQVLQTKETNPAATELKSEVGDHNGKDENNQLNLIGASYSDQAKASDNLKAALEYYYSTTNLSSKVASERDTDLNSIKASSTDLPTRITQTITAVGPNIFAMYQIGAEARKPNIPRAVMPQTETKMSGSLITSIPNFNQTTATKKKLKKLK